MTDHSREDTRISYSRARVSFLAALQLADSALPIGRFAHSAGLESFVTSNPDADEATVIELVESFVLDGAGPLDGAAVAHAHRAESVDPLLALDRAVTARKLGPPARLASVACGGRLAVLALRLVEATPLTELCREIRAGATDGNLAVVEGALTKALGLEREEAVLVELRGVTAQLLSAAVRLGKLSATRAQEAQRELEPAILEAATHALELPITMMRSTVPELDIYSLRHEHAEASLFMT